MFRALSRMRFMSDSVYSRLQTLMPRLNPAVDPNKDRRTALVLAFGGYAYTLMAEYMCEATINVGSKLYTPKELADIGIAKFEQAIAIATAAGSQANDVKNLSYVGLARAATAAGNKAKVMEAARQVPSSFIWWVEYKDQIDSNDMLGNVTGGNHNPGIHPNMLKNWG